MKDSRNDIGELVELKVAVENAIEKGDKDELKTCYDNFRNLYKKITGKDFEEGLSDEKLSQIERVINWDVPQPLRILEQNEEEIEI